MVNIVGMDLPRDSLLSDLMACRKDMFVDDGCEKADVSLLTLNLLKIGTSARQLFLKQCRRTRRTEAQLRWGLW
jgi:hypothetical protein